MAEQSRHSHSSRRRKAVDSYRFSNWDRRAGFDRRRGPRRRREVPVVVERRGTKDRRTAQRRLSSKPHMPQPVGRFRQATDILSPGMLEKRPGVVAADYKVLERHGTTFTVYSAWEEAEAVADGADYRLIRGRTYRKIGSALYDIESPDAIEAAALFYEAECQRAYTVIYAQLPELIGRVQEKDGEVIDSYTGRNGSDPSR